MPQYNNNFDLESYKLAVASYLWAMYNFRLSLFKSQSHFFLQKIIAYHRCILHVIVISYAKLNKSLVIFFFLNCTLKCCCLTINFKMMYRYIDHVKLDIHVKISVSYTFYDIVNRSAMIKILCHLSSCCEISWRQI